ncbi:MOSC domain-containing protein [Nocardioides marinquilinus]|uniref:MOSC domain-containing protein n=2 Tax=Nocardioides marinquilinus TaxID=1210400 RepID=A0ABP9PME1_9ACTN
MRVVALRRYPVKGLGGEGLASVPLDGRGLAGDRWFAVEDDDGRFASAKDTRRFRRRDAVLGYRAATASDGGVTVTDGTDAWRVGDAALDAELSRTTGASVRVTPEAGVPHQDMGAVSLVGTATLDWCAAAWDLDADPRRLRVNLVVETTEPFAEERWVGREVECGGARLRVVERAPRCRTIDLDQDGAVARGRWLRPLAAERDLCLAVYADVVRPGLVTVGDPVHEVAGGRLTS